MKLWIPYLLIILFLNSGTILAEEKINSLGVKAYQHTKDILNFGPRSLGSKGHELTQNFIKNRLTPFTSLFYNVSDDVKTPLGIMNIKNYIGVLDPTSPKKNETIALLAHYDSKYFNDFTFLGADDSASSVGLILALADYFYKHPLKYISLEFIFLDGEEAIEDWSKEDSLYGSRLLSRVWSKKNRQTDFKAMILLDMIGGIKASFCRESNSDRAIMNEIWFIAKKKKLSSLFKRDCMVSIGDDHIPFIQEGFPIIDIISSPFPDYWHTKEDNIDKISPAILDKVGNILIEYIKKQDEIAQDN